MEADHRPTAWQNLWNTLPGVWALVILAGVFIVVSRGMVAPNDFWWHLRAGEVIVQQRIIPSTDLFSFTRLGQPWVYQSWLTEVLFYVLFKADGIPLLILLKTVLVTASYTLLLRITFINSDGNLRYAALGVLFAAVLALTNTGLRPQVVTFPLLSWTMWCVSREERSPAHNRALWSLPPLFVVWANSHGGFIFGLALLAISSAGQLVDNLRMHAPLPKRLIVVSLLCAATVLVTPMGVGVVNYVLEFVRHPITSQLNQEFLPPTIRTLTGQLFFGVTGLLVALLVTSRYQPSLSEALRLLVFGGLALSASRCVVWFGFVAAPSVAAALAYWFRERIVMSAPKVGLRWINRMIITFMLVLCILSLPWLRPYLPIPGASPGFYTAETPEQAIVYLCKLNQEQPITLYHTESAGSYLIWACPQIPVFIDTRIELYPPEQWRDHIAIGNALYTWEELLAKYEIDTLLLQTDLQSELISAVEASLSWQRTYEDKVFVVFKKRENG